MYWEQHFSALGMAFFYEDLREHLYVNTGVFDVEISNVIFDLPEEIPNLLIYDVYLVRYFLELQTRSYKVADRHSLHPPQRQKSHVSVSLVIRLDKHLVNNSEYIHKIIVGAGNNGLKRTIRKNNGRVPKYQRKLL
jgi:hypothetical protein